MGAITKREEYLRAGAFEMEAAKHVFELVDCLLLESCTPICLLLLVMKYHTVEVAEMLLQLCGVELLAEDHARDYLEGIVLV